MDFLEKKLAGQFKKCETPLGVEHKVNNNDDDESKDFFKNKLLKNFQKLMLFDLLIPKIDRSFAAVKRRRWCG